MRKGIVIRIPKSIELSSELHRILEARFPGFRPKYYDEKLNYYRNFVRRVKSLNKAFLFIIDAYPYPSPSNLFTKDTLKEYANECKTASLKVRGSADGLHQELEKFTAKLVEVIHFIWKCSKPEEAVNLLNEAEQYVLMSQGRCDLATIMCIKLNKNISYVIQLDESLPPYYDQLLDELKKIKDENYIKTPSWLRKVEEYQHAYLCNLDPKIATPIEILQDFNKFLTQWKLIKNKALSLSTDLQRIVNDFFPLPSWFNELIFHHQGMIRVLAVDPNNLEKNLSQFKNLITSEDFKRSYRHTLASIARIPQWYWVLPEHQQFFLEHVLRGVEKIEDALTFVSSRHRTLPLPANYAVHSLLIVSDDGTIRELSGKRYRSSHIASRDGLEWPASVQKRHVDSNLAKVMERVNTNQLALLQTLISPIHGAEYLAWAADLLLLPEVPPDLDLYKLARAAVERQKQFLCIQQNNHPFNLAKRLFYTQSSDKDSLNLLAVVKKYIPSNPELALLVKEYKSVLDSSLGSATIFDYAGRELFLSSLEQLIILTLGGYSYGSCVSGKDRKGIELIHTDAMILYKEYYGVWPVFNETKENRHCFVVLVACLYLSRHQHEHAGQSARGSEGMKTPELYLPVDIAVEIKKRLNSDKALEEDNRIATDNEVKYIFKGGIPKLKEYMVPDTQLMCCLVARQLGEEYCTMLYNALHLLINEKKQFIPSPDESSTRWGLFSSSTQKYPGIKLIRKVMHDPCSGKDNVLRLEKILKIVSETPLNNPSRSTLATNSVYDRLSSFLNPIGINFSVSLAQTVEEWTILFDSSKASTSGANSYSKCSSP